MVNHNISVPVIISTLLRIPLSYQDDPHPRVQTQTSPLRSRVMSPDDHTRLFEQLFVHSGYHREIRPLYDPRPLNVSVQMWFKQILKMDEVDQVVSVYFWLEQVWTDPSLAWSLADFGGVDSIAVPASTVWQPDILVYNSASLKPAEDRVTNVIIRHTGQVMLFRALITDIACSLDMAYFPFDQGLEQACSLMLSSWTYDGAQISLSALTEKDLLAFYIPNSEWTLRQFRHKARLRQYDCCPAPFSDISYHFVLQRNPAYYILSLIVPSAFITLVAVGGFFVPHSSSGENTEKVTLGVTALLSLAIILLMVADKLPATSRGLPLIGIYYIGLIVLIFLATVASTVCLNLQLRGQSNRPVPPKWRTFFFVTIPRFTFTRYHSRGGDEKESWRLLPRSVLVPDMCWYPEDEINESTHLLRIKRDSKSFGCDTIHSETLDRTDVILESIRGILSRLQSDLRLKDRQKEIQKDWQLVARMLERVLMIVFTLVLSVFCLVVLSIRGPDVLLTDEFMAATPH